EGRRDQQVKVGGYRVELGEIEAVVREQAGVREVVVVAQAGEGAIGQELVGYVVMEEGSGSWREKQKGLREEVRRRLPEYMEVRRWVRVEGLAQTASGKVDRRRLVEEDKRRRV